MKQLLKNLLSISLMLSFSTFAKPIVPVPEQIAGSQRADAEQLIDMAAKLKNLVIIDSRIPGDRQIGYIEHSISLPDAKTNCKSLAKIVPQKNTPVIFYCNGVKCGRSVIATNIALKCGYSNVFWFRGGFEEWKSKEYPYLHE